MRKRINIGIAFFIFTLCAISVNGQFRFGIFAGPSLNQVNGDNLSGFNHVGLSTGLLGGYKLKGGNTLVVDLGFNMYGSNRGSEKIPSTSNKILLETTINTINILAGYQFNFGNRWDGEKYFSFKGGLNYHRIVKFSNSILTRNISIEDKSIVEDNFNNQYISLHFSFGRVMSERAKLNVGFDYGLGSMLASSQYGLSSIAPYNIFSTLSYHFF